MSAVGPSGYKNGGVVGPNPKRQRESAVGPTDKAIGPDSSTMTTGGSGGGGRRAGLLSVNDLNYLLEPDLSVAVNVTHKNHYFQSNDY